MNLSSHQSRVGRSPIATHFAKLRKERAAVSAAPAKTQRASKKPAAKASRKSDAAASRFAHLGGSVPMPSKGPEARMAAAANSGQMRVDAGRALTESGASLIENARARAKADSERRAMLAAQARGDRPAAPSDDGTAKAKAILAASLRSHGYKE